MHELFWILKPPYMLFDFGVFLIFLGTVFFSMGKAYERGGGWVYRDKEPKRFWWAIALYYLGGFLCLGFFFYGINRPPN
jgi:hypothetical protein